MSIFENINSDSVEKAVDIKPTFPLPKMDDEPVSYIIAGTPFEIETPNSKYNKTANKMPVKLGELDGEIFIPPSLEFQIAVSMKKLELKPTIKNFEKIIGKTITVWMTQDEVTGNDYYNCQISD